MKVITALLLAFSLFIYTSCEGPMGPAGPPGENGINILGTVFEVDWDFTEENDYMLFFEFPDDVEIFTSDIILVYIRWDQTDNDTDIWRLLPQSVVLKDG